MEQLVIFYDDILHELITSTELGGGSKMPNIDNKDELIKSLFKNFLNEKNEITIQNFRNFFFFLKQFKGKNFIFDIFRNYNHKEIISMDCRHFLLSFYTKEKESLDVKLSDGIYSSYNAAAFELLIKTKGNIIYQSKAHNINILYLSTMKIYIYSI